MTALQKSAHREIVCVVFGALLLAWGSLAEAQQTKKVPRIGWLSANSPSSGRESVEGFRQGLRELGYVEEQTIAIEYRYAEG